MNELKDKWWNMAKKKINRYRAKHHQKLLNNDNHGKAKLWLMKTAALEHAQKTFDPIKGHTVGKHYVNSMYYLMRDWQEANKIMYDMVYPEGEPLEEDKTENIIEPEKERTFEKILARLVETMKKHPEDWTPEISEIIYNACEEGDPKLILKKLNEKNIEKAQSKYHTKFRPMLVALCISAQGSHAYAKAKGQRIKAHLKKYFS